MQETARRRRAVSCILLRRFSHTIRKCAGRTQGTKQNFSARTTALDDALGVGRCFDMTARDLTIGGRRARLWVVNGYAQEGVLERIIAQWLAAPDLTDMKTPDAFLQRFVTACDAAVCLKKEAAVLGVFSGKTLLVVDGWDGGILMDVKQFPTRSIEEPDTSRVLRGSHDGFVENLMQNAALLRRRIRDSRLTLERVQLDNRSHTDVVLCYMDGEADPDLLAEIRENLENMQVGSIAMSQESVAEALSPRQFWNPFPKVRYTERPDVATACIMEGDVVVMVDNSPSALLLPTTLLRFTEEINDYYFPPLIGSYLQIVRMAVLLLTLFVTPVWYLLVKNPDTLHENLHFMLIQDESSVPLILRILVVGRIFAVVKMATINTPDVLSNSFSMIGALILGDFAVQARWLVPEVLVYMAFVAIANYAQHSYEMGYATKLCRMLLLILIWLFDLWGLLAGVAAILVMMAVTKPLVGKGYLYPLIPFDGKKLKRLLHRVPIRKDNS